MYLVLIRHGEAEPLTGELRDQDRELTRAGYRAMRASLPDAVRLLPSEGSITIWTSPLIRARQTAGLVMESIESVWGRSRIPSETPRMVHSLVSSGIDALIEDFVRHRKWQKDGSSTLILVGHVPQFADLATFLTGTEIGVKKGTSLCLKTDDSIVKECADLEDPSEIRKRLKGSMKMCWLVAGPEFSRWQTLVDLEKILAEGCTEVLDAFVHFNEHPEDEETVHDLRIAIRTLRSLVTFITPFQKKKQNRRMQRALRSLVGLLSHLRDLDVLIAESAKVDSPPEHLCPELQSLREEECERVKREFARRRSVDYLNHAKQDFSRIEWKKKVEREGLPAKDLAERFDRMSRLFNKEMKSVDFRDHTATHALRKQAKQIRYTASGLETVIGSRQKVLDSMKKMQNRLGALCDARVNTKLLKEIRTREHLTGDAIRQIDQLIELEQKEENRLVEKLEKKQD